MTADEIDAMIERAAERGARRALESVGLHDEHAGRDIHDLRTLIDGWRTTKKTILEAVLRWLTIGVLGIASLGLWWKLHEK
jgi:hypothetical protein